jgi:FKBP-type peptidyl-prolyl cis-trans isomerase FklB
MIIKYIKVSTICLALFLSTSSISNGQNITNKLDSISYSIGVVIAKNLNGQGIKDLNDDLVAKGMKDFNESQTKAISEQECEEIFKQQMKEINDAKKSGAKSKGLAYLAENMKKPGVRVTDSGLQYEVMKSGTGPKPTATDKVKTHYHGMLTDGTVFDSSVDRGTPISFQVGGVIQGWQEALKLMSVGDKWRLVIPSELAYGARGAGAKIPPHSTLVFEVELLGIE